MMEEQEKDKVIQELLNSMGEEYLKGARAMFNSITQESCTEGGCKRCVVCNVGLKFLKQESKKIEELNGFDRLKVLNEIKEKEVEIVIREKEKQALQNEINNLRQKLPTTKGGDAIVEKSKLTDKEVYEQGEAEDYR